MATWKKVIVSGSNVSQLNNDAGYLTTSTVPKFNAFATASFNGNLLLADSPSGSLNFASSSGQGLTIVANTGTDTLTFGLAAIPNSSLANSTFNVGAGSGLTGGGSANLGGTSTVNVGAGTHITVNADDIAVNTTTLIPAISGSIFSQVSGDITITSAGVATIAANSVALGTDTTGDYVATVTGGAGLTGAGTGEGSTPTLAVGAGTHITVNADDVAVNTTTLIPAITGSILTGISGSIYSQVSGDITITTAGVATIAANSVALGTDTTGNYVATLGTGTGVTIGANTGEGSTPTIAVNYGSTANTAVQGNTNITINGTSNQIAVTGTPAQALGGGPSYTLALPTSVSLTNLVVAGNLAVQGTASFQSTTNLEVADRFVLLASGSNSTGDGGFVIQQATQNVGELFGWDSTLLRWGVTGSFTANQPGYTPEAFMATVSTLSSVNPNTTGPASRYNALGNIYVSSNDESIWIYS